MKLFFPLLAASSVASMMTGLAFVELVSPIQIDPDRFLSGRSIAAMLLVLPFVETAVFQWMLIESAISVGGWMPGKLPAKISVWIGALMSCIAFVWVHFAMNGGFSGVVYGIEGGVILSLMYVVNRERGREYAFFSTWMLHAASNGLLLLTLKFFAEVLP